MQKIREIGVKIYENFVNYHFLPCVMNFGIFANILNLFKKIIYTCENTSFIY